jgi:hypothetical protein
MASEGVLALDSDGFEFFRVEFDVLALTQLVAFDDVVLRHLVASLGINLAIPDAVAGFLVELVEADLFAFGCGWEQCDRTRNERQLEITFPVCTRGHGTLLRKQNHPAPLSPVDRGRSINDSEVVAYCSLYVRGKMRT